MSKTTTGWTCAFSLAAALAAVAPAAAQTPGCTNEITALPYTASSSGTYCLKNTMYTLLSSGAAITVTGYQVTIDLRGFAINNIGGGTSSTAVGIVATGRSNITIRNGRIQSFKTGITLDNSGATDTYGNVVEDVQIDSVRSAGVVLNGRAHQVRNCAVTRYGNPDSIVTPAHGILVDGEGILIEGNVVAESYSTTAHGITVEGDDHLIVGNRVLRPQSYGLFLANATGTKYRDNMVTGAFTAYYGGIDSGNNQ
jgi:hypothetical protein